jgi:hypothetical protein
MTEVRQLRNAHLISSHADEGTLRRRTPFISTDMSAPSTSAG